MLHPLQNVIVVILVLVNLWWDIIETEITLFSTSQKHVWKDAGQPAIAILEGMNAHKPEMGNGRSNNTIHRLLTIKPCEELFHLLFNTVWRRSNIVDFLAPKHSADNMLLVCAVLTYFYFAAFTIAWREKCSLPRT